MTMTLFGIILGGIWGLIWALCLQTFPGRFLAARFTWLTVVVGVGVDLMIALLVVPLDAWLPMAGIIAASSGPIIYRSLFNEMRDYQTMVRMRRDNADKTGE